MTQQDTKTKLKAEEVALKASEIFYRAGAMTRTALAVVEAKDSYFEHTGLKEDCLVYQLEAMYSLLTEWDKYFSSLEISLSKMRHEELNLETVED